MPLNLDTPLDPGDMDSGVYDHVKITDQRHSTRRNHFMLMLEYGTIVDGAWVTGKSSPTSDELPSNVIIDGEDYVTMVSTAEALPGELLYSAVKRGFYEFLIAKYPRFAGTIV